MSNTVIQIKRSTTTAVPTNLQPGELAYTSNGEVLYIGSVLGSNTANVVAIAGQRNPGVLTANQALVANASSWIDSLQTTKLIVGAVGETINIASINTTSNSTALGVASNTELATTYAIKKFVDDKTAAISGAVSDTQIVFSNSGVFTGSSSFTFNDDTLTLAVSNTVIVGTNVTLSNNVISVGNSTVNTTIDNVSLSTNNITTSGLANLNSANVVSNLNVGGALRAGNTTITGDLTVTGTVTTVDTVNLVIEDSLIRLARNQANTSAFTDAVDIGLYGVFGNTSATFYSGFARESGTENWILFANTVNAPDNDGVEIGLGSLGTLYGYLNSSGLTTNSSSVQLTANSTVNISITANTISLATPLAVNSGGTGVSSLTNNSILIGNSAGPVTQLLSSTEGHVLQITSGVPAFGMLDGGTF